jgi:DNA-binding beta-propeller fold protein YncE
MATTLHRANGMKWTRLRGRPWLPGAMVAAAIVATGACDDAEDPCTRPQAICTWAGNGEKAYNGDGLGREVTALYWPMDLDFAPNGGPAYLLDWQNHRVRRITAQGLVETVMGNDLVGDGPRDQGDMKPEGAPGIDVELNHPTDVTFSPLDGSVLVAAWHNHKIRRLDPQTGRVTVLVGSGAGKTGDGAAAKAALLNQPKAVALDAAGNIFVADSRNHRIRKIDAATGFIATIAGNGMAGFAGDGGQPLTASFHMQYEMCTTAEDGKVTCTNENPEPGGGITLDDQGNLYVADTYNNRIRKIDLAAGVVSTVAGTGAAEFSGDGGPALAASFRLPRDLEFRAGRLYIADTDNHRVRMIDLATGIIQTVAGNGHPGFGGDRGPAPQASLHRPFGIALDSEGNLYVADTFNNRIRRINQ